MLKTAEIRPLVNLETKLA